MLTSGEIVPLSRTALKQLIEGRSLRSEASGRRQVPRWSFPGAVELWIPDRRNGERYALATCQNLSINGVGISCEEALKPGTQLPVAIHQPEVSFHGRAVVRHCTRMDSEYYCGLEFVFDRQAGAA